MKIFTNLIILLALAANVCYSQTWKTIDIAEFARIDFPVLPEISNAPQELIFNISDSSALYMVTVRDLSTRNLNLTPDQLPEVYRGVIEGTLNRSKGQLLEQRDIEIDGNPGVEILYISNDNPHLPELRSKRVFLVKQHLINIDFWTTEDLKQIAELNKIKYFNSFEIGSKTDESSKAEVPTDQSKAYKQGYNSGYYIGKFIIPLIFISAILLIVYFIRKKKKKYNK